MTSRIDNLVYILSNSCTYEDMHMRTDLYC